MGRPREGRGGRDGAGSGAVSKEFLHKGGKCGNGAATTTTTTKNDSITEFPALPPPPYIRRQCSGRRHRENAGTQFSPVPILHPIKSVPSPSHDCNLDARMPFERAPSLKSPLIYIIAKTEKKGDLAGVDVRVRTWSVQPSAAAERRER